MAAHHRGFGSENASSRRAGTTSLSRPCPPATHRCRTTARRLHGQAGDFNVGVAREPAAASDATGTAGPEDDAAAPGDDDGLEYYMEWIEASNPHLISTKRPLKVWISLVR
jgi:hypothetical protein